MEPLLKFIIASFPPIIVAIFLVLLFPEKIEKWASMLWYALSKFGTVFKSAHKRAIKLDLQGSLNDYVKFISKEVPQIGNFKVEVELVDKEISKQIFLSDDKVILRLRKDDPYEMSFVHGAYLFVSTSLLYRVKRYISQSQREALDLYVTTRLIEKEKPSTVDCFLEEYLHPQLQDPRSKKSNYYDKFAHIDESGLFYPVLLEELDILGKKVFGNRREDKIIIEVDGFVEFLGEVSNRKVGDDETDLNFKRDYCRVAIMIVGKKVVLADSINPYIKFIREKLFVQEIETIYVLGRLENEGHILKVCEEVGDIYWNSKIRKTKTILRFDDGSSEKADQLVVVLRMVGASVFQPS